VEVASGRVSFRGLTATPPVVYLMADASEDGIAGFLVGTDPQASSGVVVRRTIDSPSYSPSHVAGIYAASTAEDLDGLNPAFLGAISFHGDGLVYNHPATEAGRTESAPTRHNQRQLRWIRQPGREKVYFCDQRHSSICHSEFRRSIPIGLGRGNSSPPVTQAARETRGAASETCGTSRRYTPVWISSFRVREPINSCVHSATLGI
jgi:hypothetical protein